MTYPRRVDIDTVVAENDEGPVTVAEQIVNRIRATGAPLSLAARASGVDTEVAEAWRRRGAAARTRGRAGLEVDDAEAPYAEFYAGLERADAEIELALLGAIAREATGGFDIGKTVETTIDGKVHSKATTKQTARPTWQAAAWLRDHGADPAPPTALELLERADGTPIVIPAHERTAQLRAWLSPPPALEPGETPTD